MEKLEEHRVVACACFVVAYLFACAAVCPFDGGFDAFALPEKVARQDAEWALSTSCGLAAVLGLILLWPYGVRSWRAGAAAGLLAAFAVGGFHVLGYSAACLPPALFAGFMGGLVFLVIGGRRPGACALLGVEMCLATIQVIFIIFN